MAQPSQSTPFYHVGAVLADYFWPDALSSHCSQSLSASSVDDSNWEPDGVTHHVRFCEGPGVTVGWLRYCGTAGKPGGNRENKPQPETPEVPGLLTNK